jgi:glycosyltransferase involved in cell wall biosynthesis
VSSQERRVVLLSPGDPEQRTGGYLYNKHLVQAWKDMGLQAEILPLSWPLADGDAARVEALGSQVHVLADGLLWESLAPRLRERRGVVLVHSLRVWEPGQPKAALDEELEALGQAAGLICTGPEVQGILAAAGLESALALPGTEGRPGPQPTGAPHLLCAATLTRRKGHARLLRALAKVPDLPWTLDCVGALDREPQTAQAVAELIQELGMGERVRLLGQADEMATHYHRAHALVHAAHHEAFGMVLSEAVAHGRPVLSTPAGALACLPSAAVLALDDDLVGLSSYLREPALREALHQGAQGADLPTWPDTARTIWRALERSS